MFNENDKYLVRARKLLLFFTIFFSIAGIIAGIILSIMEEIAIGLPILFCVPFICWCVWSGVMLHLSFLCDVKLIRNKLYGESNYNLKAFIDESDNNSQPIEEKKPQKPMQDNTDALLTLKTLYDSGVLTEAEYNNEKSKLL